MEEILAKAAELGRAIRGTAAFRALRDAEAAVMASPDSVKLAEAIATLHGERTSRAAAGKPLDAATAERIGKVAAAVAADPLLQALSRAQQEFQAVVDGVNRTMLAELRTGE